MSLQTTHHDEDVKQLHKLGYAQELSRRMSGFSNFAKAILFGSCAQDKMDLSSDIDVLVIGVHDTLELQKKISQLQKSVDREINVISMGTTEYNKKQKRDHLLKSIDQKKSITIL